MQAEWWSCGFLHVERNCSDVGSGCKIVSQCTGLAIFDFFDDGFVLLIVPTFIGATGGLEFCYEFGHFLDVFIFFGVC
jgi:hypothetical protein